MPLPIKPVHSLDLHEDLFDAPSMEGLGLSDIRKLLNKMTDKDKIKDLRKRVKAYNDLKGFKDFPTKVAEKGHVIRLQVLILLHLPRSTVPVHSGLKGNHV